MLIGGNYVLLFFDYYLKFVSISLAVGTFSVRRLRMAYVAV